MKISFVKSVRNLNKYELSFWLCSLVCIFLSMIVGGENDPVIIIASLVGATGLIFLSKGDPIAHLICILFGILYSVVSFRYHYYGEIITYIGMTCVTSAISFVTWIKNPYKDNQVRVSRLNTLQYVMIFVLSGLVTFIFYFVLKFLGTANLPISTLSIATSFLAALFMILRIEYYALAYVCNDIVLIVLWSIASLDDIRYLPMIICFVIFFILDFYGFINWKRMKKHQK